MLTRKQHDLLMFIHERVQRDGVPPSFDEMKDALDLRSKSGIHRLMTALEERGYIRRLPHRARAVEILRLPENMGGGPRSPGFEPRVIEGGGTTPAATTPDQTLPAHLPAEVTSVPLIGRIAAGMPIEALEQGAQSLGVPQSMVSGRGEHFALEVKGDSMIEAGILDGDIVVIQRQDTANTGDIVVALIEEREATLKRLRRRGGAIALEAANPAYETRVLRADQVRIQGRMVGLIRNC